MGKTCRTARLGLLAGLATTLTTAACASAAPAPPASLPFVRFDGARSNDHVGGAVAVAGDVNGDGHADVVIGAPSARSAPGRRGGAAYVVFGPFAPGEEVDLGSLGARGFTMSATPKHSGWLTGYSVARAGDVNGDGLMDVIVGEPSAAAEDEGRFVTPGRAYVVFGRRRPHDVELSSLGAGGITLTGRTQFFPDAFGWQVSGAGDVDGDGLADVAILAPGNPGYENAYTPGRAYVVFGRRAGGSITMRRLGRHGFRLGGDGELLGANAIAAAGDWNGDGRGDVAVTGYNANGGEGAVYVVYGKRYRRDVRVAHLGRDGLWIRGGQDAPPYRLSNPALAGGADVNGDGRPDLVVGEPRNGKGGAAWLIGGTRSRGPISMFPPGPRGWAVARAGVPRWDAGSSVAVGRVDADARADVVLLAHGTPYVVYGTRTERTASLASLSPAQGFAIDAAQEPPPVEPEVPGTQAFTTVAAGDVTGDGRAEILAGAFSAGHLGRDRAGAVYLFFAP
jgi:hypothetical protein